MPQNIDVLIAGAGPSGISTALHLIQKDKTWKDRVIVLDKATFPRPKLCGGGLSLFAIDILHQLGLDLDIPHVIINQLQLVFADNAYVVEEEAFLRITRREIFDDWLLKNSIARGIEVHQNEEIIAIETNPTLQVITTTETYTPKVLVVADGSNSFIKRKLNWQRGKVARLLEILTPANSSDHAFQSGVATFDFTPMMRGLQGYYWDFPSLIQGRATMNRGIYDSRIHPKQPRIPLQTEFKRQLARRGISLSEYPLSGHPIHLFDPAAEFSRPHILLVGDAAGADPLFGEGIPAALAYGEVAADEIIASWQEKDLEFTKYKTRILHHPLLGQLRYRTLAARALYRLTRKPHLAKQLWKLTPVMFNILARTKPRYLPLRTPRMIRQTYHLD